MTYYLMIVYLTFAGSPPAIYEFSGPWTLQQCAAKIQETTQRASREHPNGQTSGQCVPFLKG